jgi:cell division protein ZapA (FtsZ GTPase activity inhibitor)
MVEELVPITIKIAGIELPLRVSSEDASIVNEAVAKVNEKHKFFKEQYKVDDTHKILGMVLLSIATEWVKQSKAQHPPLNTKLFEDKLMELSQAISNLQ